MSESKGSYGSGSSRSDKDRHSPSSSQVRSDRYQQQKDSTGAKSLLETPTTVLTEVLSQLGLNAEIVKLVGDYSHCIEGQFVMKFGSAGADDGKLSYPHMIDIANNELFVVDHENHRVQVLRRGDGKFVRKFGVKGIGPGEFLFPTGIAIFGDEVFVSQFLYPRIQVFRRTDGKFLRMWGEAGDGEGQMSTPGGICIHREEVYVSDGGSHHFVQVYSLLGEFKRKFGTNLVDPCAVTAVGDKVFVADKSECSRYILVFDTKGRFLDRIGKIYQACNVLAVMDLLIVSDCGSNRVLVFDHTNKRVLKRWPDKFMKLNQPTRRCGKFTQPMGLACVGDELYIADSWNHQIQLFV